MKIKKVEQIIKNIKENDDWGGIDYVVKYFARHIKKNTRIRYSNSRNELEDLTQQCMIALLKAIEKFDISKGVKFTTYATNIINGEIKKYVYSNIYYGGKLTRKYTAEYIKLNKKENLSPKEAGKKQFLEDIITGNLNYKVFYSEDATDMDDNVIEKDFKDTLAGKELYLLECRESGLSRRETKMSKTEYNETLTSLKVKYFKYFRG